PTALRASASALSTASDAVKVSDNDGCCRFADITCHIEASASRSYSPTRKVYSACGDKDYASPMDIIEAEADILYFFKMQSVVTKDPRITV
ncbi:hypothetical protein JI435_418890, partial [Parastagonospora nodorum SN15]